MILSGSEIRNRRIIEPFCERTRYNGLTYGVSFCGYDVRVDQRLEIPPGGFTLASTLEKFDMPTDLVGIVHDKSTWARLGLAAQNTVIEPGWKGYLTLELTNHSDKVIRIDDSTAIVQVLFHRILNPDDKGYDGKYQDQKRGPQPAKLEK
ncbi:dCTP deaminase [Brucella intermedia]|uniref:dCTP deaminase n=1 Tax=Brucella TaxID=234 RepID=UPI0009464B4E|nr:dCTP deaminase [Brucella intermedia]